MFNFGNANEGQRKAIATAEGPVLITAGPGNRQNLYARSTSNLSHRGMRRKAGKHFYCHFHGEGGKGTNYENHE